MTVATATGREPRVAPSLRPPAEVMRLARMGCAFPTRISFTRSLIRYLHTQRATVTRPLWEIDAEGFGRAVYALVLGGRVYSLVALSQPLAPEARTDRVIAEAWDTAYTLFDGAPTAADLERLAANLPHQEAGRYQASELVLSRANRSVRIFEHVAARLAAGQQPSAELIRQVGYLMRTTAVYGNGKFGVADRSRIADRPALGAPFRLELLTVWLIREFTLDLVEHIAHTRNPAGAVPLAPELKRHLGIGNATGLGMAPFLVNHPVLIHRWAVARERALARVRAIREATPDTVQAFRRIVPRALAHLDEWRVADADAQQRIGQVREALETLCRCTDPGWFSKPYPWDRLVRRGQDYSWECQEFLLSLVLEPHGALVDDLDAELADDSGPVWEPGMSLAALQQQLQAGFGWIRGVDFSTASARQRFWYVSEEKIEPRLGLRFEEPGAEHELPLDIARQVQDLAMALETADPETTVAQFVAACPEHRHAIRRVQTQACYPYAEIRENLIGSECLPIDMLRWKLAQFGASKFDPKSDRWTRITLFQGAPLRETLHDAGADDWCFPALTALA